MLTSCKEKVYKLPVLDYGHRMVAKDMGQLRLLTALNTTTPVVKQEGVWQKRPAYWHIMDMLPAQTALDGRTKV